MAEMTVIDAEEAPILPPPGRRRDQSAAPRDTPQHAFGDLLPGRIVHYVMHSGECRAAMVVYVHRSKGPLVEIGRDADGEPIRRQRWLAPDNGNCALQVDIHPVFDRSEFHPETPVAGRVFRESVTYKTLDCWDPVPSTWHWPTESHA